MEGWKRGGEMMQRQEREREREEKRELKGSFKKGSAEWRPWHIRRF